MDIEGDKPKTPTSSFLLFYHDKKKELSEQYGEVLASSIAKIASKEWKKLPEKEREKYQRRSEEGKDRYMKEMKEYKEQHEEEIKAVLKRRRKQYRENWARKRAQAAEKEPKKAVRK
jgi:hypothetical protein